MRSCLLLILVFVLLQRQAITQTSLPALQPERVAKYDIQHIALNLQFDWKKKKAFGTAEIKFRPLHSTNKFCLDAAMLTIDSISIQNRKLAFSYDGSAQNDALQISLDRIYMPHELISIKIAYNTNYISDIDPANLSGSVGKGLRFSQPTSNDPRKPREIYSSGEYQGNRYWFPCYDSPDDWRTTELTATVDSGLRVLSNGMLQKTAINNNNTVSFQFAQSIPYANHLTSVIVGPYSEIIQQAAYPRNIVLSSYGYKNELAETKASVERLPDMMQYFSKATGVPYPFKIYSQVFVQDLPNWIGGNTVSTITENMVDDHETHADFFYLWDLTEAEALANQWFGNHTGPGSWSDIWLARSFSRYFNFMYCEYKNGRDEFLTYLLSYDHSMYLNDWYNGYRHPIVTKHFKDVAGFMTDNYSYGRGAEVLHMLRKHLGDERFLAVIKRYLTTNPGRPATTKDFADAVRQVSKEPMDWFFDQWIYKIGHPVFEVTKEYDSSRKQLTLQVKQVQTPDTTTAYLTQQFFQGKLEISIDGDIKEVFIEPRKLNSYQFRLKEKPSLVNFDHESTWIKELKFEKPVDELLYQSQFDKDILGRYWAVNELATLISSQKIDSAGKEKIKKTYLEILRGNCYWRFKLFLLPHLSNLMPRNANNEIMLDKETTGTILTLIQREKSWLKAGAVSFLGASRDSKYDSLYIDLLASESFRVVNTAAAALGKTKSAKAYTALKQLISRPSMKSQSLLCALSGLRELGDTTSFLIAYHSIADSSLPRWRLPNGSVWDYRVWAATNIAVLQMGSRAYPLIYKRLLKAMDEEDLDGIFNNALLVAVLAAPEGIEAFAMLRKKFAGDENKLSAVAQYEAQLKTNLKK